MKPKALFVLIAIVVVIWQDTRRTGVVGTVGRFVYVCLGFLYGLGHQNIPPTYCTARLNYDALGITA